jgi:hypothetical protein
VLAHVQANGQGEVLFIQGVTAIGAHRRVLEKFLRVNSLQDQVTLIAASLASAGARAGFVVPACSSVTTSGTTLTLFDDEYSDTP